MSLPKKSDSPSEEVKKAGGDLYDTKKALVTTIETVHKKGKSK